MREDGLPIPKDRVGQVLSQDCVEYFDAFVYLSDRRQWSQGTPLPFLLTEIEAYMRITGVTATDERLKLIRLVGKLDEIERTHIFNKSKPK